MNINGSTFTMQGGTISANTGRNGGVWLSNRSVFIMEGGTIYGKADSLPAGTDTSLANIGTGTDFGVALDVNNMATAKWGTGGKYTKDGVSQVSGSNIGRSDETLIAISGR
jgi:hypothetical protein